MKHSLLHTCILLIIGSLGSSAHAITLLSWADSTDRGFTPGAPSLAANVTGGNLTIGSGLLADVAGVSATEVIITVRHANTASLDLAIAANDYIQFSLAPASGYSLDLDTLQINPRGTGLNWTIRSSLDSYTANLIAPSTSLSPATVTLGSSFDALLSAVTFRMYVWGTSSNSVNVGLENLGSATTVQGSVTAVPEPDTIALLAFAALGAVFVGKRIRRSSRLS